MSQSEGSRKRKRKRGKSRNGRTMKPGDRLNVTFTLPPDWDDEAMIRWFVGAGIVYEIAVSRIDNAAIASKN